jgi:antitoxin ChpS
MATVTLRALGGSVVMSLPRQILSMLHLGVGSQAEVSVEDGRLIVEPKIKPKYILSDLLAKCTEENMAHDAGTLACCDSSLWEVAMLVSKRRLNSGTDSQKFIQLILAARNIKVLPITAEIAARSTLPEFYPHDDPADRIIAASTILHKPCSILINVAKACTRN